MDYKYYRDMNHNYMVISGEKNDKDKYQYKMLTTNKIRSFIQCSEHNLNGSTYLYYEVDSRQTIKNMYSSKKMNYEQLCSLLRDILDAADNISEYLLSFDGIMLSGDFIFEDIETGEHSFIYCPFNSDKDIGQIFAMEIIDYIDQNDDRASNLAYKLCDLSQNKGVLLQDIIKICLKDSIEIHDKYESVINVKQNIINTSYMNDVRPESESFISNQDAKEYTYNMDDQDEYDEDDITYKNKKEKIIKERKATGKGAFIFSALFGIVIISLFYIRYAYILSYSESIITLIVMIVSILMSVISFITGVIKRALSESEMNDTDDIDDNEDENIYDDIDNDNYIYEASENMSKKAQDIRYSQTFSHNNSYEKANRIIGDDSCGATVLLDMSYNKKKYKLYGKDSGGTVCIDLDKLPITIGKLKGVADKVIKDSTVSRLHARIYEKEDGSIVLQDMNSTNGTFHNGERLEPNDIVELDIGDEVCFGRVSFNCR